MAAGHDDSLAEGALPPVKARPAPRPRLGRLGRAIIWRFALFAALTLLILAALGAYVAWRQLGDVRASQKQNANWLAYLMDNWFQELENTLTQTAQYPGLMDLSAEGMTYNLREAMAHNSAIFSISLVDARPDKRGIEIIRVGDGVTFPGVDRSGEEWFQGTLAQGRYVGSLDYGESGMPVVTMARAIEKGGQVTGVIVADAHVSWAYALLRQLNSAEKGSYVYVVDSQGRPVLHDRTAFVFAHQARTDIAGVRAAIDKAGVPFSYAGLNEKGERVIGDYQALQSMPSWIVIAEQPLPWVVQGLLPLGYAAIGILLLSVAVTMVVGLYISGRVARPIILLREGARQIGSGDLVHRIALPGRNEIVELADEFNRMAENLHSSQARLEAWSHELEGRVAERTGELTKALQQLQQEDGVRDNLLRTIREMSSPVIPVMEGIIVMPIVGALDSERAQRVTEDLLAGIERERARVVILDITGLAVVDTAVANTLLHAAQAAQLLGSQSILVGISPEVAETLVQLGVEIRGLRTAATLQQGLRLAQRML